MGQLCSARPLHLSKPCRRSAGIALAVLEPLLKQLDAINPELAAAKTPEVVPFAGAMPQRSAT